MTVSSSSSRVRAESVADRPRRPKPASHRPRSVSSAGRSVGPVPSSSGKCTVPMPRSTLGSTAHRSATARARASRVRRPDSPMPARVASSPATSAISLPDFRYPSALPRSTWRGSRTTSRRAASSTSAVGPSVRSTCRTALVSTVETPCSAAKPTARAARTASPRPRWETSSTTRSVCATTARQRSRCPRARSGRRTASARPTSESGPSKTNTPPAAACSAIRSELQTGRPRSPARWVALTSRHNAAHPPACCAISVTRGCRRSTNAPPRAGVRRRGPSPDPPATARSTPKIGRSPADMHAFANLTAP